MTFDETYHEYKERTNLLIKELEDKNELLDKELMRLSEKVNKLEREKENLKKENENLTQENKKLKQENSVLRKAEEKFFFR